MKYCLWLYDCFNKKNVVVWKLSGGLLRLLGVLLVNYCGSGGENINK